MNKRLFLTMSVLVLLAILAACGATPTTAPPPPPATKAPQPTTAPQPTKVPPTKVPQITVNLWHAWQGAEDTVLKEVVGRFMSKNPNVTVQLLYVPFDQLQSKFTTEAGAGAGPDMLIGPVDWVSSLAEAGLLAPLDEAVSDVIGDMYPFTVEPLKYQGTLYGFPESFECVAMYYNTSLVPTPPATMDELKTLAGTVGAGLNTGAYHAFGLIGAFGGKLFDENYKCILDQGGTVDFLKFMQEMAGTTGVTASDDGGKLDTLFKEEQIGVLVANGPWASGDYVDALGAEKVGVAPMPKPATGLGGAPFMGIKLFMFNANSDPAHLEAAVNFVKYFTSAEILTLMMNRAGHLPASSKVEIPADNVIVNGFIAQAASAVPFPPGTVMGAYWGPAGDMIKKAIAGEATPEEAVTEATRLINEANKK